MILTIGLFESGIKYHHYTHVYRLLHKWDFKQKVRRKVHVSSASKEEKEQLKKELKILDNLPKGLAVVSLDESFFFFFDSVIKKLWIEENSRSIVTVTDSHRTFCMFGATSLDRRQQQQLFHKYD
jgi:hypothetical protein